MSQALDFLTGEGNKWLERNRDKLPMEEDPVMTALEQCEFIKPLKVLEIGCSNGWRLTKLKEKYDCEVYGCDPSRDAVREAREAGLDVHCGSTCSDDFGLRFKRFDMIIFGFCLYLTDRECLMQAVASADMRLIDNGHIVIWDFMKPEQPFRTPYKHKKGIYSYHMDYPKLFLANPAYRPVMSYAPPTDPGDETLVTILQKRVTLAYEDIS